MNMLKLIAVTAEAELPDVVGDPVLGGETSMWENVLTGGEKFITLLGNVFTFCADNELCQMFLTVTFIGIGVKYLGRVTHAFGRR